MTLRSFALRSLVLAALGVPLGACWVDPDPQPAPQTTTPAPSTTSEPKQPTSQTPVHADIGTGKTMTADPGKGAGVFVEYRGEGTWYVWSTCDTPRTGTACNYKLHMTPEAGSRFQAPSMDDSGANDNRFDAIEAQQLDVSFTTTSEIDGVQFRVEPAGSALQLEARLDGDADGRILFWVGSDDVLHTGAPSDPIIFDPSGP